MKKVDMLQTQINLLKENLNSNHDDSKELDN